MTTPTAIHLTTGEILHVVNDDCIINEATGSCVAVVRERPTADRERGVLIPQGAISYFVLPAGQVRVVLEAARNAGAKGSVPA